MSESGPPLKFRIILNPRSQGLIGRSIDEVTKNIERAIVKAGHQVDEIALYQDIDHSFNVVLANHDFDVLMVGGGDGTLKSAATKLLNTEIALAPLPLGTVCLLARDLKIPRRIREATRLLAKGRIDTMDVAYINDEIFLSCCAFGLAASVCEIREEVRDAEISDWPDLLFDITHTITDAEPIRMIIDDGQRPNTIRTHVAFVSNNAFHWNGTRLLHRDTLSSGKLAFYAQPLPSRWQAIGTMLRTIFGGFRQPETFSESLSQLEIETTPDLLTVTIDGELSQLRSPFTLRIEPGALRIVRPNKQAPPLLNELLSIKESLTPARHRR